MTKLLAAAIWLQVLAVAAGYEISALAAVTLPIMGALILSKEK